MSFIVFAIIGMTEIGPNVCKIEYMRYVDVESFTLPCSEIKTMELKTDGSR